MSRKWIIAAAALLIAVLILVTVAITSRKEAVDPEGQRQAPQQR